MSKRHELAGYPSIIILGLCAALVVSCATTSRAVKEAEPPESRLPPGAIAYGFADVPQMKTVIEDIVPGLLNDKNAARFVDKSDYAVFGVYQDISHVPQSGVRNYFLITRGTYPASSYNFALGLSPNWEKVTIDGKKWWRQGTVALLIEKNEAHIQIGHIKQTGRAPEQTPSPASSGELDAFFADARRNTGKDETPLAFACYVPPSETAGFIRRLGIPFDISLQNITLTAFAGTRAGTSYQSTLSLKTRSPSEAKALSAILSLARATIGRRVPPNAANTLITELLFANPSAVDGSTVIISGAFPLDALIHMIKRQ